VTRARRARRRRLITAAFSLAGHAAVLFALLSAQTFPPRVLELAPIAVELVNAPPAPPAPKPAPDAPAPPTPKKKPTPAKPPPPRNIARRTPLPPPPDVEPLAAGDGPTADGVAEVSDAELAGAATAGSGSGSGGGECNMTRRLQAALRKDRLVQAAVADAHQGLGGGGKAIRVWNGDWVRHGGQEGDGLAAVREAIMWEVGFAPEACRTQRVHGLVAISLNDTPGSARLVVGSGEWRWSDVLFSAGGGRRTSRR
jgi:hypothetical protein